MVKYINLIAYTVEDGVLYLGAMETELLFREQASDYPHDGLEHT